MVSPNATRHMYIISFQLDSMSLTMLSTTLSVPVPEKNDMNVDCANGGTQRQKNIVLKWQVILQFYSNQKRYKAQVGFSNE